MMREGRGRTSHPSVRGRLPRVIRELVCASDSCPRRGVNAMTSIVGRGLDESAKARIAAQVKECGRSVEVEDRDFNSVGHAFEHRAGAVACGSVDWQDRRTSGS